jgi:3-deoxy-D-manno-octulosonic acid kinase
MLADPACIGNLSKDAQESLFDPEVWRARGELVAVTGGRGAAWFIAAGATQWVLRHFRRGGFIARFLQDDYVWAGENRVRAFVEWRLLELLSERGLPVPKPVAARYRRAGLLYRCDLITQRIMAAEPLSAVLARRALPESLWHLIGATVARLHRAGVDHADLNAHNLLLDAHGRISVIDFDRGRVRAPGEWRSRNLQRLRRSLLKISRGLPAGRFSDAVWSAVLAGYRAE